MGGSLEYNDECESLYPYQPQISNDLVHHPPYKPNTDEILKPSLKHKIIENRRNRLLNYNLGFIGGFGLGFELNQNEDNWLINIMEERILRYRDPINQTSIEQSLNGKHIYQISNDETMVSSKSENNQLLIPKPDINDYGGLDIDTINFMKQLKDKFTTKSSTLNTSIINLIYADSGTINYEFNETSNNSNCHHNNDNEGQFIKSQPFEIEDLNEFDKNYNNNSNHNILNVTNEETNNTNKFWKIICNNTICLCSSIDGNNT